MEIAHQFELAIMAGNGTSPVTPLSAAQTTSASIGGIVEAIVGALKPLSSAMNVSSADPLVAGFMNVLYYGLGLSDLVFPDETFFTNTSDPRLRSIMGLSPAVNRTSILSEYSFLSNMTRNPTLNHLIVAIAEGYIITVAVVFVFILVFLIREWVVQQQPGINMDAGFNAEFPGDRPVRGQRDQAVQADHHNAPARLARPAIENEPEVRDVGNRPMARVRRRNTEIEAAEHAEPRPGLHDSTNVPAHPQNREALGQNRPAPVRDALAPATDIQRRLTEEPRMTEEFLAIWRRANGIPDDVLRLINEENKAEEMRYWVNAMEGIKKNSSRTDGSGAHDTRYSGPSVDSFLPSSPNNLTGSPVVRPGSNGGMGGSDSWVDVAKTVSYRKANTVLGSGDQKEEINSSEASEMASGKGKAKEIPKEPLDPATQLLLGMDFAKTNQALGHPDRSSNSPFPHNSPRPRAISDAPHKRDSIAPFGRDNWSFSHLDKENVDPSTSSRFDLPDVGSSKSAFDPKLKSYLAEDETPERLASKAAQDPYVRASRKGREAEEAQKSNLGSEFGVSEPTDTDIVGSTTAEDFDEAMNRPVKVVGQDGISRTYENVHEMFEANLVSASDSREDVHAIQGAQLDPVIPDTPLPEPREPTVQRAPDPQGFLGNVADFLWGQIEEDQGADDERVIQDLAAEAPFVPVGHHDHFEQAEEPPEEDREVVEAANVAGLDPNDPEAIEDAEDFEGIMELIGMRGPIFSLVQNALFCALLLALTVAFGVWIPYNIGRVSLLLAANPGPAFKLPLRLVFWCAAFLQDLAVSVIGLTSYLTILIVSVPLKAFFSSAPAAGWSAAALRISNDAVNRILDGAITNIINFSETEMFTFSAASHEALLTLKYLIIDTLDEIGRNVIYLFIGDYQVSLAGFGKAFLFLMIGAHKLLSGFLAFITNPENWVISLEVAKRSTPLDLELSIWGGWDRFWAVLSGYTALSVLGALYVKKGTPFSNGQVGREWEATIIDLLHQAGGVLKVILIISIEMLVFPLYCGLLLDAALLPLFEGATIVSRILFTFNSPFTSIFVHWFVGTCYMFHFALFVSMCRKIMRKGVLCKLIDPTTQPCAYERRLHP
jgi:E3 ubiquitin-protein ligase MARCH6